MFDLEKVGSGIVDFAKEGCLNPYEAHAHVVRALRRAGYVSEPLETLILASLERLAVIADLKDELSALGVAQDRAPRKNPTRAS